MAFHLIREAELRAECKALIDSLEVWLRRVIDVVLKDEYGENYIEARHPNSEEYVYGRKVREALLSRSSANPARYPRPIDAATLEEEMHIVCHHKYYKLRFQPFFGYMFPLGVEQLRLHLRRLIEPRNALYHSNWISIRQAEQVICYANDIIDSIKHGFQEENMNQDFNVPAVLRVSDSKYGRFEEPQFRNELGLGARLYFDDEPNEPLTVGDTISLEVEVDPSFTPSEYRIGWECSGSLARGDRFPDGNRFALTLKDEHVGETFLVTCTVISSKKWHRYTSFDDQIILSYRVLPTESRGQAKTAPVSSMPNPSDQTAQAPRRKRRFERRRGS